MYFCESQSALDSRKKIIYFWMILYWPNQGDFKSIGT